MRTETIHLTPTAAERTPGHPVLAARVAVDPALAAAVTQPPRVEQVRAAVAESNQRLAENGSELSFQLDDELGRVIVRLIDVKTKQVLRQIPSAEALAIAKALAEYQKRGTLLRDDA